MFSVFTSLEAGYRSAPRDRPYPETSANSLLIAQLIDRLTQPANEVASGGPLQRSLADSGEHLSRSLDRMSQVQRSRLEVTLGVAGLAELVSLAGEGDSALFAEGFLAFGQRQEAEGRTELAAQIYAAIPSDSPASGRARLRLDAILGRGALSGRTEFLLRRLAQESAEPSMLLAMGGAAAVFRVTRLATLGRLAANPSANLLTRGFGARTLASLAGFALEAPAFTLTGRLSAAALGRTQDWSLAALGHDLAASYLMLGGLKVAGAAGAGLYRRFGTESLLARGLFTQGSMLSGLLGAHWLEERVGLRRHLDGATTLIDSLTMLLQFHVAGNLTRAAFGSRVEAWEQRFDLQAQLLAQGELGGHQVSRPGGLPNLGLRPALIGAGEPLSEIEGRAFDESHLGIRVLMSKMQEPGNGPGRQGRPLGSSAYAEAEVNPNNLDNDISTFLLTSGDNFELGLRTFIEKQPIATAVARLESGNKQFGRIFMANRKFRELFGYTEEEAGQHNITHFFHTMSLPFIAARIWGIFRGGIFNPTDMKFRHRDGSWVEIRGSGVIKNVQGNSIAFGFYEPRENGERRSQSQEQILEALRASNQTRRIQAGKDGHIEIESILELSGQLIRDKSELLQQVLAQDVRIRITNMPWVQSMDTYSEPLLRYFDVQSRKHDFPVGRRIIIELPGTDSRPRTSICIVKFSDGFRLLGSAEMEGRPPTPPAPPVTDGLPTRPGATTTAPPAPESPIPAPVVPDARSADALSRLQNSLGTAFDEVRDRVAREDVEVRLAERFNADFLDQNRDAIQGELQALTGKRTPVSLGRLVTVVIPTDRGEVRWLFRKVLLKFEFAGVAP